MCCRRPSFTGRGHLFQATSGAADGVLRFDVMEGTTPMTADRVGMIVGRMARANLAAGERLAMLIAMNLADPTTGRVCISQRAVADAACVSVLTVGSALAKMRAARLARRVSDHAPNRHPAEWDFSPCARSAPGKRCAVGPSRLTKQ